MPRLLTQAEKDALEQAIDATSLHTVLLALAEICNEKAQHIEVNWQDTRTARPWDRDARKLVNLTVEN